MEETCMDGLKSNRDATEASLTLQPSTHEHMYSQTK